MNGGRPALGAEPVLTGAGEGRVSATAVIPRDHPVFTGHFPGFPVFPAVYLIELVHRSARAAHPEVAAYRAIERCRLRSPVLPGDTVDIAVELTPSGVGLRCVGTVRTRRGTAAEIRLLCGEGTAP
ncbi:3-hydroxyacyl-ACP dehydratase FabZ family protein [Amycolatopsis sp. YIM 10]|uniref:3-hydroxyacyl-ACP dehydratase FabZ family protein n=1 Tax=Amycolatopsis sp. YIM 10 TaxID=2653857 RepID=UPI00128FE13F|nr:hypothetical protein [Amycolatopsis sp. YIM 10]QFU90539.1 3-hydroxyacyl-[acyl-carrier-protein] dehydratase FabZ [Amycolatopsis sp. YIM 10]